MKISQNLAELIHIAQQIQAELNVDTSMLRVEMGNIVEGNSANYRLKHSKYHQTLVDTFNKYQSVERERLYRDILVLIEENILFIQSKIVQTMQNPNVNVTAAAKMVKDKIMAGEYEVETRNQPIIGLGVQLAFTPLRLNTTQVLINELLMSPEDSFCIVHQLKGGEMACVAADVKVMNNLAYALAGNRNLNLNMTEIKKDFMRVLEGEESKYISGMKIHAHHVDLNGKMYEHRGYLKLGTNMREKFFSKGLQKALGITINATKVIAKAEKAKNSEFGAAVNNIHQHGLVSTEQPLLANSQNSIGNEDLLLLGKANTENSGSSIPMFLLLVAAVAGVGFVATKFFRHNSLVKLLFGEKSPHKRNDDLSDYVDPTHESQLFLGSV